MSNTTQDIAIGKDANTRWEHIHEKKAERDKIREKSGKQGIRATPVGEFGAKDFKGIDAKPQFVGTPEPDKD
jgi:hypothetical protein